MQPARHPSLSGERVGGRGLQARRLSGGAARNSGRRGSGLGTGLPFVLTRTGSAYSHTGLSCVYRTYLRRKAARAEGPMKAHARHAYPSRAHIPYTYSTGHHTYPKPDSLRYSLAYSHNSYSIKYPHILLVPYCASSWATRLSHKTRSVAFQPPSTSS